MLIILCCLRSLAREVQEQDPVASGGEVEGRVNSDVYRPVHSLEELQGSKRGSMRVLRCDRNPTQVDAACC